MMLVTVPALTTAPSCSQPTLSRAPTAGVNGDRDKPFSIDGTWATNCEIIDDTPTKMVLAVAGSSAIKTVYLYSDTHCSKQESKAVYTQTFELGKPTPQPIGAFEINETVSKIALTLYTPEILQFANGTPSLDIPPSICGGGFTINVARDLDAANCLNDVFFGFEFKPKFDIVKLEGEKLYFGESDEIHDKTDTSRRPVTLKSLHYTKNDLGGNGVGGTTGTTTASNIDFSKYIGTWQSSDDHYTSEYTIPSIDVNGFGRGSNSIVVHMDSKTVINFNFTLSEGIKNLDALKIDMSVINVQFENISPIFPARFCNKEFAPGEKQTLTATQCDGEDLDIFFFQHSKQIVKVEENMLFFGDCTDQEKCVSSYPTNLENTYYVRKAIGKPRFIVLGSRYISIDQCEKYTLMSDSPLTTQLSFSQNSSLSGAIYSDSDCTELVSSASPKVMAAQSQSLDFYFKPINPSAQGLVTIDLRDTRTPIATGLVSLSVYVQNKFTISTPNSSLTVGQCYPITVTAAYPLAVPAFVIAAGQFSYWGISYSDQACQTILTSTNRPQIGGPGGSNSATFYFEPTGIVNADFNVYIGYTEPTWSSDNILLNVSGAVTTYSTHISPIISANCLACHSGSSPAAGLNLSTLENVQTNHFSIMSRINSFENPMPPAPAAKLSPSQISTFYRWGENATFAP